MDTEPAFQWKDLQMESRDPFPCRKWITVHFCYL